MTTIFAETALLPGGWAQDVTVSVGPDGRISKVAQSSENHAQHSVSVLLPAPGNVHSHAFQRAMAGLTERRGETGQDSFWTWRQMMYRFLDHLTPGDVEVIAAQAQMEMLEAGYAAVGEFHYLHHQPDGSSYHDPAEMAARIAAAADLTGIGLTLLPVLYHQGGADGRDLGPGQRRFGTEPQAFPDLLAASARALAGLPDDTVLGAAPHSLRAVSPEALRMVTEISDGPLHMHLAEQQAEVAEIRAALGARPVEWLLNNNPPDRNWCLIHCTQMTPDETTALAATGAVAGLCPITESSLGDGIFDGVRWSEAGGTMAFGTDSNISITLNGELRMLEYSQRLRDRSRATLAPPGASTGRQLFDAALSGGAVALGRDSGTIAPGRWADLVALDGAGPDLAGRSGDTLLDSWVFASVSSPVRDLWSAGRHVVQDGRHHAHERISDAFTACLRRLVPALS